MDDFISYFYLNEDKTEVLEGKVSLSCTRVVLRCRLLHPEERHPISNKWSCDEADLEWLVYNKSTYPIALEQEEDKEIFVKFIKEKHALI